MLIPCPGGLEITASGCHEGFVDAYALRQETPCRGCHTGALRRFREAFERNPMDLEEWVDWQKTCGMRDEELTQEAPPGVILIGVGQKRSRRAGRVV